MAVNVAQIDDPEGILGDPLESRANQLQGLFLLQVVPARAQEVAGDVHVDMPCSRLEYREVLVPEVHVELIGEVWRKKNGHTSSLSETREASDPELFTPLNLLSLVRIKLLTAMVILKHLIIHGPASIINILSFVHRCRVFVDYFHEPTRVLAQVEILVGARIDVPFKVFQSGLLLLSQQLKEEMEADPALARFLGIVLMHLELHDLEVEKL